MRDGMPHTVGRSSSGASSKAAHRWPTRFQARSACSLIECIRVCPKAPLTAPGRPGASMARPWSATSMRRRARMSYSASDDWFRRPAQPDRQGRQRTRARTPGPGRACSGLALGVAAGEDAGDVVEHVGRADFVVAEVTHEAALDDVDLFLRLLSTTALTSVFSLMLSF